MEYEVFSSGGGCWHSCCHYGAKTYVVDSDCPECITCYNGFNYDFKVNDMVFSYGINEPAFEPYKELYERLLENLKKHKNNI